MKPALHTCALGTALSRWTQSSDYLQTIIARVLQLSTLNTLTSITLLVSHALVQDISRQI